MSAHRTFRTPHASPATPLCGTGCHAVASSNRKSARYLFYSSPSAAQRTRLSLDDACFAKPEPAPTGERSSTVRLRKSSPACLRLHLKCLPSPKNSKLLPHMTVMRFHVSGGGAGRLVVEGKLQGRSRHTGLLPAKAGGADTGPGGEGVGAPRLPSNATHTPAPVAVPPSLPCAQTEAF